MKELRHPDDIYHMNWVEGETQWGTVICPDSLTCSTNQFIENGIIREQYIFTNKTENTVFTSDTDVAIYVPFNDSYESADICLTNRCHTHIWCGGEVSYIMALRMGGKSPHLGLSLTKGSIAGYSVKRDLSKRSNDRGDFLLHPSSFALNPNESYVIEWVLFWHDGKKDFYNKLAMYGKYLDVRAEKYILFQGEQINVYVNGSLYISEAAERLGEKVYPVAVNGVRTFIKVCVLPPLGELARARCRFIAEKQQFHKPGSPLDGAYLIYDNSEKHMYYNKESDHNAGRERIGMGVLIAAYLQRHEDEFLKTSLEKYTQFVERELFDDETGVVFNNVGRDNAWDRLYNYPWMALFFVELYKLHRDAVFLSKAVKALTSYYEKGGMKFYAINLPVYELITYLKQEKMTAESAVIFKYFQMHTDCIMSTGVNYPASEVNYEQSIVAPAADCLLQMAKLTGDKKYLEKAEEHIAVLDLFGGLQPDYHLHETAIRHWDGYWFGKKKMYGDTFPHYWSALSGNVYKEYAALTGSEEFLKKAEASIRGTLSLFNPDGSASCAMVYPLSVNGIECNFYDPWANDQDWGLYFMLKLSDEVHKY